MQDAYLSQAVCVRPRFHQELQCVRVSSVGPGAGWPHVHGGFCWAGGPVGTSLCLVLYGLGRRLGSRINSWFCWAGQNQLMVSSFWLWGCNEAIELLRSRAVLQQGSRERSPMALYVLQYPSGLQTT